MKRSIPTLFLLSVLFIAFHTTSCSFTKQTGTMKHFNKRHYKRGIVKIKPTTSKKEEMALVNDGLTKKEMRAEMKEEIKAYISGESLTAETGNSSTTEYSPEYIATTVKEGVKEKKAEYLALKEEVQHKKAKKALDKKIAKLDKLEEKSDKMIANMKASATAAADGERSREDKMSLASLILGAVSLALLGFGPGIAAIVLSVLSKDGTSTPRYARLGLILGICGLVLSLIFIPVFFFVI